ncbi:MAG: class I SAM-dependent methyltransferase [Saprospiraceae bacterium]|nr:class I SAM-dependent methyltransferase [Saprospiraceae bacterium]
MNKVPEQAMVAPDRSQHWDHVYNTSKPDAVGWYQPAPTTSLELLDMFDIPLSARIIDIGGGHSLFTDHLLEKGFKDLTVLDISRVGLQLARARIGDRPEVTWICSDITDFAPDVNYRVWHDRAVFHFLNARSDQEAYLEVARRAVTPGGLLVLGTFADDGPEQCSGLPVTRYSELALRKRFAPFFKQVHHRRVEHMTPFGTLQKYVFCVFRRLDHVFDST